MEVQKPMDTKFFGEDNSDIKGNDSALEANSFAQDMSFVADFPRPESQCSYSKELY